MRERLSKGGKQYIRVWINELSYRRMLANLRRWNTMEMELENTRIIKGKSKLTRGISRTVNLPKKRRFNDLYYISFSI